MKVLLIKKILLILILFLITTLGVNFFFSNRVSDNNYPHPSFSSFYETKKGRPIDILILGNSTSMDLDLNEITGTNIANVSAPAATPWHNYIDFKKIKNKLGPNFKVFHFIEYYQVKRVYFKYSVKAFMLSPLERYRVFGVHLDEIFFTKVFDNFYSYLRQWIFPRSLTFDSISPITSENIYQTISLDHLKLVKGKNSLNEPWSQIDIQAVLKLKSDVESMGGEFFVVFPPKHSLVLNEHKEGIRGLKELLKGVTVLNYLGLIDSRKENDQFYDLNHLNKVGLDVLQEKLNEIIAQKK